MKINCPTCLEPIEFAAEVANSLQKCPTCNNQIKVPEHRPGQKRDSPHVALQVTAPPANPRREVKRAEVRKAEVRRSEGKSTEENRKEGSKFSFRIAGSVLVMTLFLLATIVFSGLAVLFYLQSFDTEPMAEVQATFFTRGLGIASSGEYTMQLAGITVGQLVIQGLLGLIALIAISKRKRILAIAVLTLLIVIGFAVGTPFVAIFCLIMVCVPGRSDIWARGRGT